MEEAGWCKRESMPHKRKDLNITGSNLWYLVGLITSDGCLSSDGRHIDITSKDYELLEKIKMATGITNKIGSKYGFNKSHAFHIQIGNKNFYNFLLMVGLTQKKSLTLRSLNVSRKYFVDFLRGMIDGDGCIRRWIHPSNAMEQWNLRIYSGSGIFIKWLRHVMECMLNVKGKIYKETDRKWILKYGKMAAKEIAKQCYYDNCLGLSRKIKLAQECCTSHRGWSKSKTVCCGLS
ncbi:MAG: LAGLIDADG family homing endonuclease [Candidatus Omnitrophica bacterium]|nr:LAGLIDADG family homing endonuclease [Candidatus Omnitrophota bacterium]